jgi:hypothetical protein
MADEVNGFAPFDKRRKIDVSPCHTSADEGADLGTAGKIDTILAALIF